MILFLLLFFCIIQTKGTSSSSIGFLRERHDEKREDSKGICNTLNETDWRPIDRFVLLRTRPYFHLREYFLAEGSCEHKKFDLKLTFSSFENKQKVDLWNIKLEIIDFVFFFERKL